MYGALEGHHVASTSVTKASMMDELAKAVRRIVLTKPKPGEQPVVSFNSLKLCVNELGVLLPGYENEFMNTLTDLWDCKDYSETRRNKNHEPIDIKRAQLNMIAACTPSYLSDFLPEGAWDQGFISRTMLIYSGERNIASLFGKTTMDGEERELLQKELLATSNLYGEMTWSREAAELIDEFNLRDGEPAPEHPKLRSYNIRRTVHLIKLCMIASVADSPKLHIEKRHFTQALDWMIEAESYMPDIFKAMKGGGAGKIMDEAWYYIYTTYMKEDAPVAKHRVIGFLRERVPAHNIESTLRMMEQSKLIKLSLTSAGSGYVPEEKKVID